MAWQLIYTSAPRSLEAGRSGFGTVARHRAISPLLVSAIERASQFSRLPGVDAGRVIYCHRIVAIAGGRFHVLSSIRDAGADYTGRTNHIAHHLIADPREVAQLGATGPSPADVLLAMEMSWATSWAEPPRYLEAAEEIALATIRPQVDASGTAWGQVTGNPHHARLLASGEASRGAYIIPPDRVDLRALFAESLRLIPERLWQISFTSSLQPSDEPADFRWIGIEESSPLRAQIETSGRPILNLAEPGTLPEVEAVQPTAPSLARQSSRQTSQPALVEGVTFSSESTSITATRRPSAASHERTADAPRPPAPRPHSIGRWGLLAGALVIVAITTVAFLFVKPLLDRAKARDEVEAKFKASNYFTDGASRRMAIKLIPDADASRARELADASSRLVQTLLSANLAALDSAETNADLTILANRDGRDLPVELGRLRELAKEAQRLSHPSTTLSEARDAAALAQIVDGQRDDISKLAEQQAPPALVKELHGNADRQQAAGLLKMIQNRLPPPERGSFEHAVDDFKNKTSDSEATKTVAKIKDMLRERAKLAALPKPEMVLAASPPPPTEKVLPPGDKPKALSRPVLYFVENKEQLSVLEIKELAPELNFEFRNAMGVTTPLAFKHEGTIRKDFQSGKDGFQIENGKLTPETGAPNPPFVFVGRDAQDAKREVLRVYVGFPLEKENLFVDQSPSLQRDGQTLKMVGDLPAFASILEPAFRISTPVNFDGRGESRELWMNVSGECDLRPALEDLEKRIAEKRAAADRFSKQATQQSSGTKSDDSIREKATEYVKALKKDEAKKIFDPGARTAVELVGDFAKALAEEWTEKKDTSFDELRSAGTQLGNAFAKPQEAQAKNKELLLEVQKLEQKHRSAPKMDGLSKLRGLCNNLAASFGDTAAVDREVAQNRSAADAAASEAKALEQLPLLTSDILPPGEYSLMLKLKDMNDVKLYTLTVK